MSGAAATTASAIRARHAAVFRPYYRQHGRTLGGLLVAVALWLYGASAMEVSSPRLLNGLGELGRIVGLMLPPDPGSFAAVLVFAKALAETLAIAFLGTLGAATIAFPLGFLAARNTTVSLILRFLARRSFDTFPSCYPSGSARSSISLSPTRAAHPSSASWAQVVSGWCYPSRFERWSSGKCLS